ncbi:MAG: MFS transporter [Lachnospiraceae bacterium]|nr:MFS transporter [Lachnospiraceae bacterium]
MAETKNRTPAETKSQGAPKESFIARTSGITMKDKVGYAMGDFASLLVFGLVQSVLQKYYTDVLQLSIVSVLIMFVVARVWDAINDPLWGRIIDSAKRKDDGRYRRWIKIFAIPVALAAVLMFVRIPGMSETGSFIWATVTYILFGMLYTCINIPYGSLATVITSDDKERSSLSVFRSIGSTFGAMPAMALASFCYVTRDGVKSMNYTRIIIGVAVIAVLAVIGYFITYKLTKERVKTAPKPKKEKGETWHVIKALFTSRPFVAVCLASLLFLAAQMFQMSYNTYLFDYYFNATGLTMLPTICQYLPVAIVMFFATKLGNRFGRREICAYGMLLAGLSFLILFFLHTTSPWVYIAMCLVNGIGNAFLFLLVWALANDAIDYNEVHKDIHDEATSYSFYSFMRKLGQSVAAILVNSALLSIGYKDNVLNADNITEATLKSMYGQSVLIPAILYLLVFVILLFVYPLGKKQIEELKVRKEEMLARRHVE